MATQRLRRRKHKLNQLRIMRATLLALCPTVDRKVELLKKEAAESNAETTRHQSKLRSTLGQTQEGNQIVHWCA